MIKIAIIKITIAVSNGTGSCEIKVKENKNVYKVGTEKLRNSMLSDNDCAKFLLTECMKQVFDNEIKQVVTHPPKQLEIT